MKKKFEKVKAVITSCKNKVQLAVAYTLMGLFHAQYPDEDLNGFLLEAYIDKFAELDIL